MKRTVAEITWLTGRIAIGLALAQLNTPTKRATQEKVDSLSEAGATLEAMMDYLEHQLHHSQPLLPHKRHRHRNPYILRTSDSENWLAVQEDQEVSQLDQLAAQFSVNG